VSRDRELPLRSAYLDDDLMMRLLLEQEGNDGRSLVHLDNYDSHGQLEKDALPAGWKASKDQNGILYYYNKELKVTQWNHPGDLVEQSPPKRPARAVSVPERQPVYAPTVNRPLSGDSGYVERGYVERGYFPDRGRC